LHRVPTASLRLSHPQYRWACARCGAREQAEWTRRQQARLLPEPCYVLTVTVKADLRDVFLHYPQELYALIFTVMAVRNLVQEKALRRRRGVHREPAELKIRRAGCSKQSPGQAVYMHPSTNPS
jgi:hypothetical protein